MKNTPFTPRKITFPVSVHIADGRSQDLECHGLKEALMGMQTERNGRLALSKFYGHSLDGGWQFSESRDNLLHLGALDEGDQKGPLLSLQII